MLILDFLPPELKENKFQLLKSPSLWRNTQILSAYREAVLLFTFCMWEGSASAGIYYASESISGSGLARHWSLNLKQHSPSCSTNDKDDTITISIVSELNRKMGTNSSLKSNMSVLGRAQSWTI